MFDLNAGPAARSRQLSPRTDNSYNLPVLCAGKFLGSLTAFIMQDVFLTNQIKYTQLNDFFLISACEYWIGTYVGTTKIFISKEEPMIIEKLWYCFKASMIVCVQYWLCGLLMSCKDVFLIESLSLLTDINWFVNWYQYADLMDAYI